ncbi:heavy-metal-associated domain-containing protein [Lacinutrix iliipiscaria]|uniref:Heavy-metal-associated domain-containing protein n=1 Tax=Lacinutrix iliipiscaria TaxID=1230532 RepID=A0ABW5WIK7_9FLAO
MQQTYTVTGMTCNGCKASVEEQLNAIQGVIKASVNLELQEVTIKMSDDISINTLQNALSEKYSISEKKQANVFKNISAIEEHKTTIQQLFPLFLIFTFILGASILLNLNPWDSADFMLDFMGLFYVVFSFFKFLDVKGFSETFKMYDPLAKLIPVYGSVYPFIELALGIVFLMRIQIPFALILTLIILGITTVGVTKSLLDKKTIQCACLGTALKLPMTKATFIENSIMIIMSILMLLKIYN